jgi:hypothetical protein
METSFTVTDFELSNTATSVSMYEHGYGFLNVPNKAKFSCHSSISETDVYVPNASPESPYIGYGWFLRSLRDIRYDEKIDTKHLMTKLTMQQLKHDVIYIIFSRRASAKAQPCPSNNPVYIGFCKTTK